MLTLDSNAIVRQRAEEKKRLSSAQRRQELEQEIRSNTITVEDDDGRPTSNLLAQLGRPMTSQDVQSRLKLCNPRLVFERAIRCPELVGIYFLKMERDVTGGWKQVKVHICGMESGIMPEFSVLHKTMKEVANPDLFGQQKPTREVTWKEVPTFYAETRGWRTVLIRLLKAGIITRYDVEKQFGWTPSQNSAKWAAHTKETICLKQ